MNRPRMKKIYIVYHSESGHVESLAEKIREGAESIPGVEARLCQVGQISLNELTNAHGFAIGFPIRKCAFSRQFKEFIDATTGKLDGKPSVIFYSAEYPSDQLERTLFNATNTIARSGLMFLPFGYQAGAGLRDIQGGTPYGAGTFVHDGSRRPSILEKDHAFAQGKYIAQQTKWLYGDTSPQPPASSF